MAPVARPRCCFCRSAMNSSCLAFLMCTPVFLPGGLPSISVWIEGIEGEGEDKQKKKKHTHISVCIYLKMDCQSLNHTGKKIGNQGRERKGHSGVTRGGISCREIAPYCFCDRGNVNWPCGCVTSRRGRTGTKWTQNTPWERFSIPDVTKTGI